LICSLFILALAGCGKSTGTEEAALVSSAFSYEAIDNGCDTGYHEFNSLAEECTGLQDEKLNHLCALSARKSFFLKKSCPGTFKSVY
jgi:hypothetical protein